MFIRKIWKICTSTLVILVLFCAIILFTGNGLLMGYAIENSENVKGEYYEFDEKNDYEFSSTELTMEAIAGKNTFGTFSLSLHPVIMKISFFLQTI